MNRGQFARSEHQIKLYKVHHYAFDSCRCEKPHGQHWDCIWDCCDWTKQKEDETTRPEVKIG